MDFWGQVWKRVWEMAFFGLKLGLDLEMRAAHPQQKFQGVPPPPRDKHFPRNHKLRKIFNRNTCTIQISYSCMNNTKQIIDNHNKRILNSSQHTDDTEDNTALSNCRQKNKCPLNGNCLQSSIIYQATVKRTDNITSETYIGLTENAFKTRYRNHIVSFLHAKLKNSTELSKHIWTATLTTLDYATKMQPT